MTTIHTPRVSGINPATGMLEFTTPGPGCDFCGRSLTGTWVRFGCRDFTRRIPGILPLGVRLVGFWAACTPCAPLVRARRWRRLVDHVTAVRVAAGIRDAAHPEVRSELAALYLQLEQHLTGEETTSGDAR